MEELLAGGEVLDLGGWPSTGDVVEWARAELRVEANPHDRLQVGFLETLRSATLEELRVIACTYEGLDAIASTQRQAELAWKARAAEAALAHRTR